MEGLLRSKAGSWGVISALSCFACCWWKRSVLMKEWCQVVLMAMMAAVSASGNHAPLGICTI